MYYYNNIGKPQQITSFKPSVENYTYRATEGSSNKTGMMVFYVILAILVIGFLYFMMRRKPENQRMYNFGANKYM